MNSPNLRLTRIGSWGIQAALTSGTFASANDLPTPTNPFGMLTGPGGKIADAVTALWIGPNSEADSVWVQGGGAQGQQPFLVSVGHPWIGYLDKDILLWQNTPGMRTASLSAHLLEIVTIPVVQGISQNFPPPSIPNTRAPMRRFETLTVTAGGNTTSLQVPVFGRKVVSLHVDNSGGAEAVTVTLQAGMAIDRYIVGGGYTSDFEDAPATVSVAAGKNSLIQVVNFGAALTGPTSAPWAQADWVRCNVATATSDKTINIGWLARD